MLKIVSILFVVLVIVGGVFFVFRWNSTTPWATGTGSIDRNKVGAMAPMDYSARV